MAPLVTTAKITCKSKEAREQAFLAFHKIVEYSREYEPGVLRYIVTVPVEDKTGTELYMIEEYASQKVSDDHLASPPVQDLIKLFTTGDVLAGAPEVHNTNTVAEKIARPAPTLSSDPAILLANISYKPGTLEKALEGWKNLVEYVEKNEEGTKAYAITAVDGGNEIRAVEVYDNWDYVFKVHAKSPAMAECTKHNGADRTGDIGLVRLRAVDGFLGRDRGGSKM